MKTKEITTLVENVGNPEGITKAGKYYYITDWAAGKLLKVDPKKKTVVDHISEHAPLDYMVLTKTLINKAIK